MTSSETMVRGNPDILVLSRSGAVESQLSVANTSEINGSGVSAHSLVPSIRNSPVSLRSFAFLRSSTSRLIRAFDTDVILSGIVVLSCLQISPVRSKVENTFHGLCH